MTLPDSCGEGWPPMNRPKKFWLLLLALCVGFGGFLLAFILRPAPDELLIGKEALARGDWAAVSRQIQRLRRDSGHTDQIQLLRGGLLLRTGDSRGAIAELMRVRPDGELREQSLLLLCEAFYQLKQWNDAAAVAQELLRRHPDHVEAHRWLGAAYFDLGALTQAEQHLRELARLAPQDYTPHRLLGVIYIDFEQYKSAIAHFQQALERNPPSAIIGEIRLELAKALIKHNQFEEALRTLDFQWLPDNVEPRVVRAECLWTMSRQEEAKRELDKARTATPDDPKVLWLTARMALDENRIDDALKSLQQVIAIEPTNHQALYEISLAYRRLGKVPEAQDFLERRNAAHTLYERLVELNKQAIKEPENATIRQELATVCDQLGKKELAAVWRDAAAALKRGEAGH